MEVTKQSNSELGKQMERAGSLWLEKKNLTVLARNFHSRFGEIDLIMLDEHNTLIFVEVKYRFSNEFGAGLEQVTRSKQKKIIKTAQVYLLKQKGKDPDCRFDVLSITQKDNELVFDWIKNAFQVS